MTMTMTMTMTLRSLALPLAALPLALALGCPAVEPPPPPPPPPVGQCTVDLSFPTRPGSLDTSIPIEPATPVTGTLCPARDDDGYRITLPQPSTVIVVTLSMATNITNVDPSYVIVRDNGDGTTTAIGGAEDPQREVQGHATNFTAAHRAELAGDYIIIVKDVEGLDDGFDNVNEYTLSVELVADPDGNEPNNVPAEAASLAPGVTNAVIATSGDEDWYAIEAVGNAQIIDVTLSVPAGSGIEHTATLFAPDGITVLQSVALAVDPADETQETARIRKSVNGVAGEPFLLIVKDGGADGELDSSLDVAAAQYAVELALLADPDGNEGAVGNESLATATTVTDNQTLTGALASFADQDTYRIAPPAGTTAANPGVLVVTVTFSGALDAAFKPQLRAVTADPENGAGTCNAACTLCYDTTKCGEVRLQRFIQTSPFRTAVPLRNTEPVFVSVNEFNDDAFQESGDYTITFELEDDGDPGEAGDDFLIPNLEEAGYANDEDLFRQRNESRDRARVRTSGFPAACPGGTSLTDPPVNGPGCADLVQVVAPNPFFSENFTIDPADVDAAPRTVNMTGRLTYEGDRDYFIIPDFPARGYVHMELDYNLSSASPIEVAVFVHGANDQLAGSMLEGAEQQNGCSLAEGGQLACAAGTICVDERCWTDGPSNPAISDVFGDGDECVLAFGPTVSAPIMVEVVDNGINDFDLNMTYSIDLTIIPGCPSSCDDPNQDFCQDG